MFCPNCNVFLNEPDLIKSSVKKWENTEIEYDATCPACRMDIGRMSWGKLTVSPSLQARIEREQAVKGRQAQQQAVTGAPPAPVRPVRQAAARPAEEPAPPATVPFCPHCGNQLPDDVSRLPRRPMPGSR